METEGKYTLEGQVQETAYSGNCMKFKQKMNGCHKSAFTVSNLMRYMTKFFGTVLEIRFVFSVF